MAHKRALIIVNKNWEAVALMNVLLESKACPDNFPCPARLNHPLPSERTWNNPEPRAVFRFPRENKKKSHEIRVEVWCLQDAMKPSVSSSSTKEKVRALSAVFSGKDKGTDSSKAPDCVVSVGTAGFPDETSYNGCVVVGANTFIHDPFKGEQPANDGYWDSELTDRLLLPSAYSAELFNPGYQIFDESLASEVESRFIVPPMNPAQRQIMVAASTYTAVSVVNVMNCDDYAWANKEALQAFETVSEECQRKAPTGALETTHGIIQIESGTPFIYISGITNRVGHFNMEVGPRPYAQNFACAHNAGVVAAWLIPRIVRVLSSEE